MRDLAIWRRLHDGTATAADLAAIAALPLLRRAAYVGGALALVTHGDPAIRVGAIRVLAGARGVEGVRVIVSALDDEHLEVRHAAVEALREVARDAPVRYAHALFHARVDVRTAALSIELPTALAEIAIYLRADPACRDLARQKARWPEKSLALAFALRADGHIYETELVDHVLNHTPGELR
jgi:HEAT repeat protein